MASNRNNLKMDAFRTAACVCHERGYVVKGGNFQACDLCEAGAEWAAAHQPAEVETGVHTVQTPAAPAPVKVRRSARFDGLVYEFEGDVIRFRYGVAFTAYALTEKGPRVVDCSDRYSLPHLMSHYCMRFAEDLSRKLAGKAVA